MVLVGALPPPDGYPLRKAEGRAAVAIYHCHVKVISRATGRSAVAAAAYRSGERLTDARLGKCHDYTRKSDIEHREILAPERTPDWMLDRAQLWNGVEAVERRKDAQLAREVEISIPRELDTEARRELVTGFVREQFVSQGMIADFSLHRGHASDGQEQPHAHVMLTMRDLTGEGFGKKNREWNAAERLEGWREAWADHSNRALERAGVDERIDHRSLADQRETARDVGDVEKVDALDREPLGKVPLSAVAMERKGTVTDRGDEQRGVRARNQDRRELVDQLREISARIADTMRGLGEKAKDVAHDLRARLSAAWGNQAADDRGAAERIAEATAQRVERDKDTPEPGSAAERIASRTGSKDRSDHDQAERDRERIRDKDRER
jgi:hypothetical protein